MQLHTLSSPEKHPVQALRQFDFPLEVIPPGPDQAAFDFSQRVGHTRLEPFQTPEMGSYFNLAEPRRRGVDTRNRGKY